MNMDDIEKFIDTGLKLNDNFDNNPTEHNALLLEQHFTIMKLLIGNSFDDLPAFQRILNKASQYLNSLKTKNVATTTSESKI